MEGKGEGEREREREKRKLASDTGPFARHDK